MSEPTEAAPESKGRLSVNLIAPSAEALRDLCETTGLNQTDVVNRALQIYQFINEQQRFGSAVIFRDKEGSHERVRFV